MSAVTGMRYLIATVRTRSVDAAPIPHRSPARVAGVSHRYRRAPNGALPRDTTGDDTDATSAAPRDSRCAFPTRGIKGDER
ncbi:hypothetical protein GCM10009609_00010 [Pseudonocardia aurantiaca]